ncbi:MAG: hypothetical protein QOH86_1049 [Sphingomonadales bacterium]|nr:hypothetical protein [Sphingomonadales bacterium]
MPNSLILPLIAGLSLAGAAVGVQLGHSAISEIDPSLFSEPEENFHAGLAPYQSPDWAQVQQAEYAQPEVVAQPEVPPACIGCVTWPLELGPQPSAATPREYRIAPEPPARVRYAGTETVPSVVVDDVPDAARERIARYSSYPVSSDDQPADAARAPAEASTEPTGL